MKVKKSLILLSAIASISTVPFNCLAANKVEISVDVEENNEQIFTSDIIIVKYRLYEGKKQYRRWNATKQCWIDPDWIDPD